MSGKLFPTTATILGVLPALPLFILALGLTAVSLWPFDALMFIWSVASVFAYATGCYAIIRLFRARSIKGPLVIVGMLTGVAALLPIIVTKAPHETWLGLALFYGPFVVALAVLTKAVRE